MRSSGGARALLAAGLGLALGCGQGIEDLSAAGAGPLLAVRASVDPAAIAGVSGEVRAALVWAGVPSVDALCLRYGLKSPLLAEACADPLRFVPGDVEPQFPTAREDGVTFDLTLRRLPSTSVSVGDARGRIAWASVLVGEDVDGDGVLGFLSAQMPDPVMEHGPDGMGPPDAATDPPQPPAPADRMLAASFITLLQSQQRLGFREGTFDAGSLFYPTPGCPTPPVGFSVVRASAYPLPPATGPGPCEIDDPARDSGVLQAVALTEKQARDLRCNPDRLRVRSPARGEPPASPDLEHECLSEGLAVYSDGGAACPSVTLFALKGCRSDPDCREPDWDFTAEPPDWWPCSAGTTP